MCDATRTEARPLREEGAEGWDGPAKGRFVTRKNPRRAHALGKNGFDRPSPRLSSHQSSSPLELQPRISSQVVRDDRCRGDAKPRPFLAEGQAVVKMQKNADFFERP